MTSDAVKAHKSDNETGSGPGTPVTRYGPGIATFRSGPGGDC